MASPHHPPGLRTGSRLGHFEIRELLGAGGVGQVYRAMDPRLGREVAIKILHREHSDRPEYRSRFEREARAVARLSHPNILRLFDVGAEEGLLYTVTELLEGETLRQRISRSALPVRETLEIGQGIAEGLQAAHSQGVIHRDLKPENIFLTRDNRVKILDFGLAAYRETEDAKPFSSGELSALSAAETRTGDIIGTAGYLSPEQARGLKVDERSDIFALGSVLYEMLTRQRAFDGSTAIDTLLAIVRDEPPPLPEGTAAQLRWILETCLQKEPSERFQSARDVALCLGAPMGSEGPAGDRPPEALPEAPRARHSKRWGLAVACLVAAMGLGAFAASWLFRPPPPEPLAVRYFSYSGQDRSPAASSDGRFLAFSSDRDGTPRIWIKQLVSGNESPLTQGPDTHPRFSPDGGQILFTRAEGLSSALFRVSTLGGEPRRLLSDASSGDFSPDGQRITFVRRISEDGRDGSILGVAAADGGGAKPLAVLDEQTVSAPRWSPDGEYIAVAESGHSNRLALFVVAAGDGEVRRIDPPPATGFLSPPAWTEDSARLLYAASENLIARQGGGARVERLDLASGRRRTLLSHPTSIESLDRLPGDRLVLEVTAPSTDLVEAPVETGGAALRWLTRGPSTDRQPVYSADGEWLIFSSNRSGNLDLWRLSMREGTLQRLTDDPADDWDPAVLPDGRIVWSSNRSGTFEIWIAGPDGTAPHQLSRDGFLAENPSASPDGRWVVYNSRAPDQPGLWRISPDGGPAILLVPGTTRLPEISPDGSHVLFLSRIRLDRLSLEVASLETGEVFPFSLEVSAAGGRARWLPDGSAIAFTAPTATGGLGIFRKEVDPLRQEAQEEPTPLLDLGSDASVESFAISPDGRRITIAQRRPELSSLMLAEPLPRNP